MTRQEAFLVVRKYSHLVGNEVTFRGASFVIRKLTVCDSATGSTVEIVFGTPGKLATSKVNFFVFYSEWTADAPNQLTR